MSEGDFGSAPAKVRELSEDERWVLANRIAASPGFAKATQLRDMLLYICKHAITEPLVELTEQEIGSRALGRRPDYDTQADNIVRVQLRHLRQKLDEYFALEGRDEPLLISIPKGSRVAVFQPRAVPVPVVVPAAVSIEMAEEASHKQILRSGLFKVTLPTLALAAAIFLLGRYSTVWSTTVPPGGDNLSSHPVWARLFEKGEQTTVVISDSSLAFAQDMLHTNLSVDDLSKGALRNLIEALSDDKMRNSLREITSRQYTSMADATVSSRLATIGSSMGSSVAVRYSRHMGIRDFNAGNIVIVGSRRGIPWVELFEPDLNFRLHVGANRQFGFLNKRPEEGESATYTTVKWPGGRYETYAIIAFVPNLKRSGDALLLEGIMMEGTEAAGEFAMSKTFAKLLADKFGATSPAQLPPFEVLLKIQAISGAPNKVDVVSWRRPDAR